MDRAAEVALAGGADGTVIVADFQARGRGTRGRSWIAPPGTCLMFSVVLQPTVGPGELGTLPLRIGRMLRAAIAGEYVPTVEVDPPNDLVVRGRKLAGVLCQSRVRAGNVEWVICGVGLNTNLVASELPVPESTSLAIETGCAVDHARLLGHLLNALTPLRQSSKPLLLAQPER